MSEIDPKTVAELLGCPVEGLRILSKKGMIKPRGKGFTEKSVDSLIKNHLFCEIMLAICEDGKPHEHNG